jgi:hypothetical protein
MLFTIFQYFPILEEDNAPLAELCKKAKESNDSSDDAPDDDSGDGDADDDGDFNIPSHLFWCQANGISLSYNHLQASYRYPIESISTPPPRF